MKIRFWFGLGLGIEPIHRSGFVEIYLVVLFIRIRVDYYNI